MKLCQCKRKFIREEVESIACYDSCTEAIIKIVESDCVCEKKEEVIVSNKPVNCAICGLVITGCGPCNTVYLENIGVEEICNICKEIREEKQQTKKQSQFPCDHNNPGKIWSYWTEGSITMYGCQKCGLVTCKNPNVPT